MELLNLAQHAVAPSEEAQSRPGAAAAPKETFVQRVLEAFEGIEADRMLQHSIRQFRQQHAEALAAAGKRRDGVLHRLQSEEAIEAVVESLREKIRLEALERQLRIARGKSELADARAIQTIQEFEEIDPQANWTLDPHRLALLAQQQEPEPDLDDLFVFARKMCEEPQKFDLETLGKGQEVPEALAHGKEFFGDLAGFLLENGAKGVQLVRAVCADPQIASAVRSSKDVPRPVLFLAQLALAHHSKHPN